MLSRLLEDHARIRETCAELTALVEGDAPCAPDALTDCRWRLARMIFRHLPIEDRSVFQPLERHPEIVVRERAAGFKRELEGLVTRFQGHAESWTPEAIVARWPEYRSAVLVLVNALTLRMNREERDLYPFVGDVPDAAAERRPEDRNWAADAWEIKAKIAG